MLCNINIEIKLIEDDCIMYHCMSFSIDRTSINYNLKRLIDWWKKWKMPINTMKSAVITISRKEVNSNYVYAINNTSLFRVTEYKYFSLTLTSDWKSNSHIDNIPSKGQPKLLSCIARLT